MNPSTPTDQKSSNGLSITSLVLGIIALIMGIAAIISIPLGMVAIVFGAIALKKRQSKGMAIAGIVTGSLAFLVGLGVVLLMAAAVPALQDNRTDTYIKNDVSYAVSAVNTYRANNNGTLPSVDEFDAPSFLEQRDLLSEAGMTYAPGVHCNGEKGDRFYSITAQLTDGSLYCLDS